MRAMLFIVLFAACTSSGTGISEVSCPTDSTLTYETFGAAFFADNCSSCHAARENPILSTQAQIKAQSSRILDAAVYTTSMPENADMTTDERALLGEWLACGAP